MRVRLFSTIIFLAVIVLPVIALAGRSEEPAVAFGLNKHLDLANSSSIPRDDLVGEYLFNEGSGNDIYDTSGQNRHGTIYGAQWVTSPGLGANGQPGYALQFDHTYASVASDALKHLPLSISLWVKPELNVNDVRNNIISNDRPNHAGHGIGINQNGYVYVEYEGVPLFSFRNTSYQVQWGQWYHIVAVYDSGHIRTYINSHLVDDFTYEPHVLDAMDSFLIGRHNFDSQLGNRVHFIGVIDSVRIYHRPLSQEEIFELYSEWCTITTDTDQDGLPNGWEVCGYYHERHAGVGEPDVNLPAMGADPTRPDIFVEVDYMEIKPSCLPFGFCTPGHNHRPKSNAIEKIVGVFKEQNINLHVDYSPNGIMNPVTGEKWDNYSEADDLPHFDKIGRSCGDNCYIWKREPALTDCSDLEELSEIYFNDLKQCYFSRAREPVFHYVVFAHQLGGNGCVSGVSRGEPGSDFIVSLGGWGFLGMDCLAADAKIGVGTVNQQAGTFMHELGHNLGLCHGGPVTLANLDNQCNVNYKPNYLSVMNYAFQTNGLRINGKEGNFDYSPFTLPELLEKNLNETIGLNDTKVAEGKYGTRYWCDVNQDEFDDSVNAIDWNCDDDEDDSSNVSENINEGPSHNHDTDFSELKSYQDWGNLQFSFPRGAIGTQGVLPDLPMESESEEISQEENLALTTDYGASITSPGNLVLLPESINVYTFTVANFGINTDTYTVTASSTLGWADLSSIPPFLTLSPETITEIPIIIHTSTSSSVGTMEEIVFSVVSQANPLMEDVAIAVIKVKNQVFLPAIFKND